MSEYSQPESSQTDYDRQGDDAEPGIAEHEEPDSLELGCGTGRGSPAVGRWKPAGGVESGDEYFVGPRTQGEHTNGGASDS